MNTQAANTVMILGANGRFGHAAVEAFAAAGWNVIAQHRAGRSPHLPAGVQTVICDATDSQALIAAAGSGVAVVVNALNPDYARWDVLVPPLAASVLALTRATGALLMLPGNVYNFGRELPAQLTEDTPQRPDGTHARVRVALERGMQEAESGGIDSVVIRAGDYLGGSQPGTWLDLAMARGLRKGWLVYPGPRTVQHAWAYLPDLARCFVAVASRRAQLKGFNRFNFGGYAVTGEAFHAACERAMGRPLKAGTQPWWLMRALALFSPLIAAVMEMRYLWDRPHALDDSRLRALIGRPPHTPLEQALAEAIQAQHLAEPEPRLSHA